MDPGDGQCPWTEEQPSRRMVGLSNERLQMALDASCAALMALEQARAALSDAPRALWRTQRAESQAIELVHIAITDLRRSTETGTAEREQPLALGFVKGTGGPEPEAEPTETG